MNQTDYKKGLLYSLAAILLWSTIATASKLTLRGMEYYQLLLISSFVSTFVLFFVLMFSNKFSIKNLIKSGNLKFGLAAGLLNPFLYYLVLFKAYSILPGQEAFLLNYIWPIVVSVFSVIFLNHKFTVPLVIGLVLAFIGVIIIATRGNVFELHFHNIFGASLAAGSSIIWASYWIVNLKNKVSVEMKLFTGFFFGSIFTFLYVIIFHGFQIQFNEYFWGGIYIGIFEMGITFFLWLKGLELSENKVKTSTLAYLAPFLSLMFLSLILDEKLMTSSLIGLICILGGIFYQQKDALKKLFAEKFK
ncbi:MAG: DMT family transporter [Melioribacteraceae bacterium]|nr:EamA family transporter [Melioribacteraceae bacterium]MDD3557602.1 DMT family transporter [Melioribacteraceae bacterium]